MILHYVRVAAQAAPKRRRQAGTVCAVPPRPLLLVGAHVRGWGPGRKGEIVRVRERRLLGLSFYVHFKCLCIVKSCLVMDFDDLVLLTHSILFLKLKSRNVAISIFRYFELGREFFYMCMKCLCYVQVDF